MNPSLELELVRAEVSAYLNVLQRRGISFTFTLTDEQIAALTLDECRLIIQELRSVARTPS